MSQLIFLGADSAPIKRREIPKMAEEHEKERLLRIEDKLDIVSDALTQLVRIEERQIQQREDFKRLEEGVKEAASAAKVAKEKAEDADKKITIWINRGMGLWGGAMLLWSALNSKIFHEFISK